MSRNEKKAAIAALGTKEESTMRGYFTANGFYGLVNGTYVLFASESDYYEAMEEAGEEE